MKVGEKFTIQYGGSIREFEVTEVIGEELTALHADLKRRGWDGFTYLAESQPKGRQRKVFKSMFLKSAKGNQIKAAY